jgi:hypothetical protein
MKHFIAVVVLLSSANCTFAQTEARRAGFLGKLGRYVATHKELLVSDLVVFGAWNADAAANRHVANFGYSERADFLNNGDTFKTYGEANLIAGAAVVVDHLLLRYYVGTDANGEKTWDRHNVTIAAGVWSFMAFAGMKNDLSRVTYCKTTGSCSASEAVGVINHINSLRTTFLTH